MVRDRTPVRAAAAEAVEHDVPVGVRLEEAPRACARRRDRRARRRCRRAPRSRATSSSRAAARSRGRRAVRTPTARPRGRRRWCSRARARLGRRGCAGSDRPRRAAGSSISPARPWNRRMSTRFTPSAAAASGCSAGAWCANASNASVSASSSRPSMIASSARQLVVAHDQYGCASRSACVARLLDGRVDAGAVAELEEILDQRRAAPRARARVQRRRVGSASASRPSATRASVPAGPISAIRRACSPDGEIVGVVPAPRFSQAALRELVALGFGVGEHERERELAEHGDEEIDVGVVETRERFAQERRARGVFEIDGDAAPAAAHQRQRRARPRRGRDGAHARDAERDADRRPALAGMTERSLGPTEADQRGALLVDLGREVGRDDEVVARDRPRGLRERGVARRRAGCASRRARSSRPPPRSGARARRARRRARQARRRGAGATVGDGSARSSRARRHERARARTRSARRRAR